MKRFAIIHYSEIGLKGKNIDYFVEKLQKFLRLKLKEKFEKNFRIQHTLGRLTIFFDEYFDEVKYADVIGKIFGIRNFKFVYEGSIELKELSKQIWEKLPKFDLKPSTFRVKVKRSMALPYSSVDAERHISAVLLDNGLDIKVNLENPEFVVDVEFFNNAAYFSFKKHQGAGGLPPNSAGKVISLISSGFDSPVAAYKMMRRGARVIFVHFHGYPYTDMDEINQVKDLVKILSNYQLDTKLYLVPFGEFQKKIATTLEIPGKIRTVLYRRNMLRIAQIIAHKEKAKGLVTGDSLGQVASQTLDNIMAVHDASTIPVFQPLISVDKEDIISISRKIGTSEISKLPCKDTCTMFMPKSPELKANVHAVREYEKHLPLDELIEKALNGAELIAFGE